MTETKRKRHHSTLSVIISCSDCVSFLGWRVEMPTEAERGKNYGDETNQCSSIFFNASCTMHMEEEGKCRTIYTERVYQGIGKYNPP